MSLRVALQRLKFRYESQFLLYGNLEVVVVFFFFVFFFLFVFFLHRVMYLFSRVVSRIGD